MPPLPNLKKNPVFFQKEPSFFFFKKTNFRIRFEKSYHFTRILRQICYNLVVKNFHGQIIGHFHSHRTLSIGKNEEKVRFERFQWMIFLPHYKCGRKIKNDIIERLGEDSSFCDKCFRKSIFKKKRLIFAFLNISTPPIFMIAPDVFCLACSADFNVPSLPGCANFLALFT